MPDRLRRNLSYANVMATIAVFVALGGSSYAAVALTKNSVKSKHIGKGQVKRPDLAKNAVRSAKVLDGSLLAADFKAGQLPAGPKGDPGPEGPPGSAGQPGEPATKLFAAINSAGTLLHGSGVTAATEDSEGNFTVTFDRPLNGCVGTASYWNENPSVGFNVLNHFALTRVNNQPNRLKVFIYNTGMAGPFSVPFSIVVFC
jgi:hypothetical protein